MNRATIKETAKEKLVGNWGWGVLTILIVALVSIFLGLLTSGVGTVVEGLVATGGSLAFLHLVDNRKDNNVFTAAFSAFTEGRALPIFLTWLLESIFLFLWALLLIVPGIVKSYSYAMSFYIVDDLKRQGKEISPTEAITKSRQLMDGHKFELFVFDLSFLGWFILGMIPFGIGTLWVNVYYRTAKAEFYRQLVAKNAEVLEETVD